MNGPFDEKEFFAALCREEVLDTNNDALTRKLIHCADKIWEKYNGEEKLKASIPFQNKPGKQYSDRWDKNGRQVVDLVQEGGGMLGIALVGYTYILEKAGIRFMSLAGTSAGGINTMMLAAIPDTVYQSSPGSASAKTKSQVLAHLIANTEFEKFIDRKGIISMIVAKIIQPHWKIWLGAIGLLFGPLLSIGVYSLLACIFKTPDLTGTEVAVYLYLSAFFSILFPVVVLFFLMMIVLGDKFGINPGVKFRDWVHQILETMGLHDTKTLMTTHMNPITLLDIHGNEDHGPVPKEGQPPGNPRRLVLIASNITHNRIVKFPDRADDYWDQPEKVYPAEYVRATMSIPFFFDVFIPSVQKNGVAVTKPSRFVDGGMLSNFPIREFHSISRPRFPTFGIKLGLDTTRTYEEKQTLPGFLFSFFNTFKEFYDNEFLMQDAEASKLISQINTGDSNWLNFWMKPAEKVDLFCRGAEEACRFLERFDWPKYGASRTPAPRS